MRIIQFTAENMKRVKVAHITPDKNIVQVTGANGSGKSTVLDCISWAIEGKRAIDAEPLRRGAENGFIELDLGKMKVRRTFAADGHTNLVVSSHEGAVYSSPQSVMEGLLGKLSMDPFAFKNLPAKERAALLADLVGLRQGMRDIAYQRQQAFERRTEVNRDVKRLTTEVKSFTVNDETAERVDVAELMQQLEAAQQHEAHEAVLRRRGESIVARMTAIETQIHEHELAIAKLREELAAGEQVREQHDQAFAAHMATPRADVVNLRAKMLHADRINTDVATRERRDEKAAELAAFVARAEELTHDIAACDAASEELVRSATMPIPGLGLTEDGVTFNDLPFEQASSAEQLRVSTAIAMALNPTLRVIRIKDGSLLDEHSLALLEQMAEEHDFQIWMEVVDTSGEVGIVMEDGVARVAVAAA